MAEDLTPAFNPDLSLALGPAPMPDSFDLSSQLDSYAPSNLQMGEPPPLDAAQIQADLDDLAGFEIEDPGSSGGPPKYAPDGFGFDTDSMMDSGYQSSGLSLQDPLELVSDPALSGSFDEMLNMVSPGTPKLNAVVFSEMSPQQLAAFSMAEFWQGEKVGDAHRQLALQNLQKMSPELAAIVMTTPEYRTLSSLETDKVELLKPSTWGAREWLMATGLLLTTYGRFSQSKQEQRNLDRRYELDERNIEYQRMIAQAQIDIQREKLEYEKNRGGGAVTVPKSSVYF